MNRLPIALYATLTIIGATPGFAAQPASTQVDRQLQERRVARGATQNSEARQQLEMEQNRLDRMIHDLESGKSVEPARFERTIKRGDALR